MMDSFTTDCPQLRTQHVDGARLFANRLDMISALARKTKRVAEIGVALGDGSRALIEAFKPEEFVALDLFELHTASEFWGRTSKDWFGDLTHEQFYNERISPHVGNLVSRKGDSSSNLMEFPQGHFDVIYVDGDHSFAGAKADTTAALKTIKDDGILIFNDYVLVDYFSRHEYGVVPCVHDVVVNQGWYVVGFALQERMFCDIALSRTPAKQFYKDLKSA